MKKEYIKKADMILIITTLLVAGLMLCFFLSKSGSTVTVYYKGEVYKSFDLKNSDNMEFSVNNVEIKAENGKVCVISSTCHDKVCVKEGFIKRAGETIACVPNGVVITISGKSRVDGVTG